MTPPIGSRGGQEEKDGARQAYTGSFYADGRTDRQQGTGRTGGTEPRRHRVSLERLHGVGEPSRLRMSEGRGKKRRRRRKQPIFFFSSRRSCPFFVVLVFFCWLSLFLSAVASLSFLNGFLESPCFVFSFFGGVAPEMECGSLNAPSRARRQLETPHPPARATENEMHVTAWHVFLHGHCGDVCLCSVARFLLVLHHIGVTSLTSLTFSNIVETRSRGF